MRRFTNEAVMAFVSTVIVVSTFALGLGWLVREHYRVYTKTEACYQAVFSNPDAKTIGLVDATGAMSTLLAAPLVDAKQQPLATGPNGQPVSRMTMLDLIIAKELQQAAQRQNQQVTVK